MSLCNRLPGSVAICAALLVLPCSIADGAERGDVDRRTFPAAAAGTLTVDLDFGSVSVRPSDDEQVHVVVERTLRATAGAEALDDLKVRYSPSGKGLRVKADYPREVPGDLRRLPLWASFELAVPRGWAVDVETGGGNVSIEGIGGTVELSTRGGNIEIIETTGSVTGFTSGGHLQVRDAFGETTARTAGGHVTARLSRQPRQDYRLVTSGGHIELFLAEGVAIDVDAATGGGRVSSQLVPEERTTGGASLRKAIGGGGPDVVLRSSGGNIEIRRLE